MRRLLMALVAAALLLPACTAEDEPSARQDDHEDDGAPRRSGDGPEGADGLVPEDQWTARQDDYLAFATSAAATDDPDGAPLDPGDPLSVLAHAEVARRAGETADLGAATPETFAPIFTKLEAFEDTSDFDVNHLLTLLLTAGDDLDPALRAAIEERVLAFKYWWTEPTPDGIVDNQYYWTENHQIIFLADEYIAGQTFRDETFANDGKTGAERMDHAEPLIRRWIELRARFGYSEWLSNVYWGEDMMGLLLLADHAEDPEIARLAAMALDVLFVELASHVQKGVFGSSKGRSYQKDKLNGRDEDTFSTVKMVFDDTPVPYAEADSATLLAVARRYRPPEVARRIAATDEVGVVRQHMGLPLDPSAPVDAEAPPPYDLAYEGEDGLMVWWGLGGHLAWQVAPLSVETINRYDLWDTDNFRKAGDIEPVVADATDDTIRELASALAIQVNPGLLSEVDSYTWRSPEVMLSTAVDWRPGVRTEQSHIWQATLDPDALVFTTHPRDDVPLAADPNDREGYWTGDGATPRSAQVGPVNISIYAPQYGSAAGIGTGAYSFGYGDLTHAFFPTEHFDEIVERDGWVIGRKGDGYVALHSWRPTSWRAYTDDEFTRDLTEPFDLVAAGGPDNVWITEVGRAADHADAEDPFAAFVDAVTGAEVQVMPMAGADPCPDPGACDHAPGDGFQVRYASPTQGVVTFGWAPQAQDEALGQLRVDDEVVELHPGPMRWDSPWATAGWDTQRYRAEADGATLDLDFRAATRQATAG